MKMTLNEEIELLRNGKWFDQINGTIPNDEYLSLGWAIGDVLDTLELLRMLQPKVETNADRIRAMSDEELAEFLEDWDFCYSYCPQGIVHSPWDPDCSQGCTEELLSWLQKPAEEETP